MKLSTAILKGSKLKPKTVGDLFTFTKKGKVYSCALGAALDAVGGFDKLGLNLSKIQEDGELKDLFPASKTFQASKTLDKEFPILLNKEKLFKHPVKKTEQDFLSNIIVNLNDYGEWSRERIAKWVAKQGY